MFDVCGGCRRCLTLCTSFPSLFEMLDGRRRWCQRCRPAHAGAAGPRRGRVLPVPAVPLQLPVRARLARVGDRLPAPDGTGHARCATPPASARSRTMVADQLLGRTDLVGKVATRAAPAINRVVGVEAGTVRRRLLAQVTGVTAQRRLAPFARGDGSRGRCGKRARDERSRPGTPSHGVPNMSRRVPAARDRPRPRRRLRPPRHRVRGRPRWAVAARRGSRRETPDGSQRTRHATSRTLAAAIRAGTDVVVAQPTCHAVITTDYVDHVGGTDAELVAARSFDAVAYLADHVDRSSGTPSNTPRQPSRPSTAATAHRPPRTVRPARRRDPLAGPPAARADRSNGHRRVQVHGRRRQMGAARRQRADRSRRRPRARRRDPTRRRADVVTGTCVLTNIAIEEQTGRTVIHPLELLAAHRSRADRRGRRRITAR